MSSFVTQAKLAETYGLHINTIRQRVGEMRQNQGRGKRYTTPVVIVDGKIILVNESAFLDWLNVRKLVNKKVNIEPYDPRNFSDGFHDDKEIDTEQIIQAVLSRISSALLGGKTNVQKII